MLLSQLCELAHMGSLYFALVGEPTNTSCFEKIIYPQSRNMRNNKSMKNEKQIPRLALVTDGREKKIRIANLITNTKTIIQIQKIHLQIPRKNYKCPNTIQYELF